jgi:ADP-ribosylation factor GTPase-activating protein 2/3
MNEYASNEERDKVFNELLRQPENKACFDCGASNPKWGSIKNGIYICFQCSTRHRTLGAKISYLRSCTMDRWKWKELEQMKLGGNKAAKAYFDKNDLTQGGQYNYTAPLAAKYRTNLEKSAEEALKSADISFEPEETKADYVEAEMVREKHPIAIKQEPIRQEQIKTEAGPILSKYFFVVINEGKDKRSKHTLKQRS